RPVRNGERPMSHRARAVPTAVPSQELPVPGRRTGPTNPFLEFRKEKIEQSIPERFEQQVRRYPDRLAAKTRSEEIRYEALNAAANRVARAILEQRGEGSEPIALLLNLGPSLFAAVLGVLKAGKFYVPLNPSFPAARLAYILEES